MKIWTLSFIRTTNRDSFWSNFDHWVSGC